MDRKAIVQAVLDYAEGGYEADPARIERSLHPDLAKRIVTTQGGKSRLDHMSAMRLVQIVRAGGASKTPREKMQKDITILDTHENAASAKLVMADWVDYMHLARYDGRWVIVNVLWELKPKSGPTNQ